MLMMLVVFAALACVLFLVLAAITFFFDKVRAKRLFQLGFSMLLLFILVTTLHYIKPRSAEQGLSFSTDFSTLHFS
jgi:energy-coupling factor transporter transmembrane protein EcfT